MKGAHAWLGLALAAAEQDVRVMTFQAPALAPNEGPAVTATGVAACETGKTLIGFCVCCRCQAVMVQQGKVQRMGGMLTCHGQVLRHESSRRTCCILCRVSSCRCAA